MYFAVGSYICHRKYGLHQGSLGPQGFTGPQGDQGFTGPQGDQGFTGPQVYAAKYPYPTSAKTGSVSGNYTYAVTYPVSGNFTFSQVSVFFYLRWFWSSKDCYLEDHFHLLR